MNRVPAPATRRACLLCGARSAAAFASVGNRVYWRCPTCLLTFLEPAQRPAPEEERAEYDLHENDPADPRYRAFLSRCTDPLLARVGTGEGLDFGCGPGPTVSVMLEERGLTVRDYDPFFRPDRTALERDYDFIVCTEVAEHFYDPAREFALLDRLLRPGGWLGLMTGQLADDEGFANWWYIREISHVTFYRRETMDWIAARFGWRTEYPARNVALFQKHIAGTDRLSGGLGYPTRR
jgi:SAM-dependent methyltransferase